MPNVNLYNQEGKEIGKAELTSEIFDVKLNSNLVHQAVVAQTANKRQVLAHTKDRSEVRGGGKKPWQQKGTGRARHGSIRSPIWKGGGVTFGPLTIRNYHTKINKQTRRLAVRMCLSDKVANSVLWILQDFSFAEAKTKMFVNLLKLFPGKSKKFLVLTAGKDEKVMRMTKNLTNIKTVRAEDVNVMDLINWDGVIASQEAVKKLEEVFGKKQ